MFEITGGDSAVQILVLDDFEELLVENSVNINNFSGLLQSVVHDTYHRHLQQAEDFTDAWDVAPALLAVSDNFRTAALIFAGENAPRLSMLINKHAEVSIIERTYSKSSVRRGRPEKAFVLVLSCPRMRLNYTHNLFPTFQ